MHDARAVANKLLDLARKDGNQLTVMQIIKLVYFCHAWMLALYHRPLILQPIEAWRYGPVIRDVHQSFKKYRDAPIKSNARVKSGAFEEEEEYIIGQVYQKYGYLSGIRLSQLTHAQGTPWQQVWAMNGHSSIIPNWMMENYSAKKAEAANVTQ